MLQAPDSPSTYLPLMTPYLGAIYWLDASARLVQTWFDWQRTAWQPVLDTQAEFYRRCCESTGWPALPGVAWRGGEQLA